MSNTNLQNGSQSGKRISTQISEFSELDLSTLNSNNINWNSNDQMTALNKKSALKRMASSFNRKRRKVSARFGRAGSKLGLDDTYLWNAKEYTERQNSIGTLDLFKYAKRREKFAVLMGILSLWYAASWQPISVFILAIMASLMGQYSKQTALILKLNETKRVEGGGGNVTVGRWEVNNEESSGHLSATTSSASALNELVIAPLTRLFRLSSGSNNSGNLIRRDLSDNFGGMIYESPANGEYDQYTSQQVSGSSPGQITWGFNDSIVGQATERATRMATEAFEESSVTGLPPTAAAVAESAHRVSLLQPLYSFISPTFDFGFSQTNQPLEDLLRNESDQFLRQSFEINGAAFALALTQLIAFFLGMTLICWAARKQASRVKVYYFTSCLHQEVTWFESIDSAGGSGSSLNALVDKYEDGIGVKLALLCYFLGHVALFALTAFYQLFKLASFCMPFVLTVGLIIAYLSEWQAAAIGQHALFAKRSLQLAEEILAAIRTVFAFNGQQKELTRYSISLQPVYKHSLVKHLYTALNTSLSKFSIFACFSAYCFYAMRLFPPYDPDGPANKSTVLAVMRGAEVSIVNILISIPFMEALQQSKGSIARIYAAIERRSKIDSASERGAQPPADQWKPSISFRMVQFGYTDRSGPTRRNSTLPFLNLPGSPGSGQAGGCGGGGGGSGSSQQELHLAQHTQGSRPNVTGRRQSLIEELADELDFECDGNEISPYFRHHQQQQQHHRSSGDTCASGSRAGHAGQTRNDDDDHGGGGCSLSNVNNGHNNINNNTSGPLDGIANINNNNGDATKTSSADNLNSMLSSAATTTTTVAAVVAKGGASASPSPGNLVMTQKQHRTLAGSSVNNTNNSSGSTNINNNNNNNNNTNNNNDNDSNIVINTRRTSALIRNLVANEIDGQRGKSKRILNYFNLEIAAGQSVALVGPSGSGKSTVLSLVQRLYDINGGQLLIGQHNIKDLNISWLRNQISVVTQEPRLFDMTIAENIRLGLTDTQDNNLNWSNSWCEARVDEDLTKAKQEANIMQQVIEASREANAHEFIMKLPAGYATRVGTGGFQLSGGQKQRIAIARALIRKPKILLLDESTSALDTESESIVAQALKIASRGRTTITVAHRLSTIKEVDLIVVMSQGQVIECGSHEELMQSHIGSPKGGVYRKMYESQLSAMKRKCVYNNSDQIASGRRELMASRKLASESTTSMGKSVSRSTLTSSARFNGDATLLKNNNSCGKIDEHSKFNDAHEEDNDDYDNERGIEAEFNKQPEVGDDDEIEEEEEEEEDDDDDDEDYPVDSEERPTAWQLWQFIEMPRWSSLAAVFICLVAGLILPMNLIAHSYLFSAFAYEELDQIGDYLYAFGLIILSFSTFVFIVTFLQVLLPGYVGEKLSSRLRVKIMDSLLSKPMFYFDMDSNSAGSLCDRFNSYISSIQSIAGTRVATMLEAVSTLAAGAMFGFGQNLPLSAFCITFAILVLITTIIESRICQREASIQQKYDAQLAHLMADALSNIKTIASLNKERFFISRFTDIVAQRENGTSKWTIWLRIFLTSLKFVMPAMSWSASMYYGCHLLVEGRIDLQTIFIVCPIVLFAVNDTFRALVFLPELLKARCAIERLYKMHRDFSPEVLATMSLGQQLEQQNRLHLEQLAAQTLAPLVSESEEAVKVRKDSVAINFDHTNSTQNNTDRANHNLSVNNQLTGGGAASSAGSRRTKKSISFIEPQSMMVSIGETDEEAAAAPGDSAAGSVGGDAQENHRQRQASICPTTTNNNNNLVNRRLSTLNALPTYMRRKSSRLNSLIPKFQVARGRIEFKDVEFAYPNRPGALVLDGFSLQVAPGESVALVGSSGSGKSTTVSILEKFYDYHAGKVTLDGHDLRLVEPHWVRSQIGLVSQEPVLLSYTIGDNIRYGDNSRFVSMDEVIEAARTANIHDFIMSLPDQYDTELSNSNYSGSQLSGGQRQRIAIARALIRNAPILIFDEATSALDNKSESVVQDALDKARRGRTSLTIAHRLATIKDADKIVVLKEGKVVEVGKHEELLRNQTGHYRALWERQENSAALTGGGGGVASSCSELSGTQVSARSQQKAATMTIIIDGATTQEWATKDEYRKLLEQSQRVGELTEVNQRQHQLERQRQAQDQRQQQQQQQQQQEQQSSMYQDHNLQPSPLLPVALSNVDLSSIGALINRMQSRERSSQQVDEQAPQVLHQNQNQIQHQPQDTRQKVLLQQQQQQEPQSEQQALGATTLEAEASASEPTEAETAQAAAKSSVADELGLVLDLMEERQRHMQRLKQIQQQQHHHQQVVAQHNQHQNQNQHQVLSEPINVASTSEATEADAPAPLPMSSARTINDLVAIGDENLDSESRLKERNSPRKYCGDILVNMLDVVCQGRFYDGGPKVVDPVIKSKRSLAHSHQLDNAHRSSPITQQHQQHSHQNHQHQHQLPASLSSSSTSSSSSPSSSSSMTKATSAQAATSRRRKPVGLDGQENNISDAAINEVSSSNSPLSSSTSLSSSQTTNLSKSSNINNNNHNNHNQNVRNKHSKMSRYRAIRGAFKDCCEQACDIDAIKAYCLA